MTITYNIRKYVISVFLFLSAALGAVSQPYCRVNTFSISQGLTTNNITHFAQDNNGLMWFSSVNGLWSFDGYDFIAYRDYAEFHSITTQRYLSARTNYSGGIYLTDNKRQLFLFDTKNNRFHNLSDVLKKHGLNMQVLDIMSLKNGYTWLVGMRNTSPGLVRICDNTVLDGKGIEVICSKPLTDATYRAIVCGNGTELIYGKIGVYTSKGKQIYRKPVLTLLNIGKRVIWGGEGNFITIYFPETNRMTSFAMPQGVNEVNNMVVIGKNRIACGTDKGVAIIDLSTRNVKLLNLQNPASPSNHVTNLFLDSSSRLWAFTESDGLTIIQRNLRDKTWMNTKTTTTENGTTCNVTLWLQDNYHTIWTIPRGGIFSYYDEKTQSLHPYLLYEQENHKYSIPSINRYFIDRQKNLWFTGPHSFNCLVFGRYFFSKVDGELFGNVRSVFVDKNGNVWTGSEKGHLIIYNKNNRKIGYVTPNGCMSSSPVIFQPNIYSIFIDRKGRKWIGTKDDGLYVIGNDGSVRNFKHDDKDPYSLSHNRVNDIMQDHNGRIWIATFGGGLNLLDESGNRLRFVNSRSGLGMKKINESIAIRRIMETKSGVMLLSTTNGLITFSSNFKSPRNISFHVFNGENDRDGFDNYDVLQTIEMKSGKIFLAIMSGEMFEIDRSSLLSRLKVKETLGEKLSDGPINGMFEDAKGFLWIVRENNLDRYSPATCKNTVFWPGRNSNYCDFTEVRPVLNHLTNYAILGAQDGYISFSPHHIVAESSTPKIMFISALVNGDKQPTPILNGRNLTLPSDKHSFTVNFAALDYSNQRFIKYAYKLEGVDRQWNNIGYNHSVSFNDLSSGTYRLLVRSTNASGQWTDNIAILVIKVTPAWWETWWAYLFYFIILGCIVYLIYKYFLIRHRASVERIVSERKTMLYREASHKLRTPLTLIGGPIVEVLKSKALSDSERDYLETARRSSRNMLKLVDDMLADNMEGSYFVDDDNAPVFGKENIGEVGDSDNIDACTRILVVEDNSDLRRFLVNLLSPSYIVITAENGKQGLDKAVAEQPDFILSDVTMPVMDGLTMVSLIKRNPEICHIPIIILSARASVDDKACGIEQGIDDYITKPFSARYLKQRMAEVIANHRVEQLASAKEIQQPTKGEYKLSSVKIVDYDKEMMSRLMAYLEENIREPNLRVDDMASAVNLSRTVFFTKLKSIVGMSPNDFVRSLRLKRAQEMMENSKLSISEISASVGFNDQRYFSRVFKKETGYTPTEFRNRVGED